MAAAGKKDSFKIGEVCRMADVQPYVLRYWETEFPALAPAKTGGGQRTYTQREVDVILRIKQLLYSEGFTIAGAKKKLDLELNAQNELTQPEPPQPREAAAPAAMPDDSRDAIRTAAKELREILTILGD